MHVSIFKTPITAASAAGQPERRSGWRDGGAAFPLSRRELRRIIAEKLG